jgi:DNA-binding transcriptional MerR regulator
VSVAIPGRIFFRIGEVADILGLKTYVIRYWEGEFPFLAPEKGASGQRVYQRAQIEMLVLVKHLLYVERYSIEGAKKRITELRRTGTLRETLNKLLNQRETDAFAPGSIIEKARIAALEEKVRELQDLIRDPKESGMTVPGLKTLQ